jgi:MFS family permease
MARRDAPRRASRAVTWLAFVAGGAWGAVGGGALLGWLAAVLGAPSGTDGGEIVPPFGWNRFTMFLLGMPVGFAAGAALAVGGARRWPWLLGVPAAILGAFVLVTAAADPSGWDTLASLLVVLVPGAVLAAWLVRRR